MTRMVESVYRLTRRANRAHSCWLNLLNTSLFTHSRLAAIPAISAIALFSWNKSINIAYSQPFNHSKIWQATNQKWHEYRIRKVRKEAGLAFRPHLFEIPFDAAEACCWKMNAGGAWSLVFVQWETCLFASWRPYGPKSFLADSMSKKGTIKESSSSLHSWNLWSTRFISFGKGSKQ